MKSGMGVFDGREHIQGESSVPWACRHLHRIMVHGRGGAESIINVIMVHGRGEAELIYQRHYGSQ